MIWTIGSQVQEHHLRLRQVLLSTLLSKTPRNESTVATLNLAKT